VAAVGDVAAVSPMRAWWLAARPRTLGVGAAPVLVGTALAWLHGSARAVPAGVALLATLLIQIGTNLANDAFDHERGADGPDRVGPARASQLGWLTPQQLKRATAGVLATATVAGLYLASVGGWPIVAIGVVSLAAAVAYTGGPWPLGYHGLGDLAVFVFFGAVAVCGTFYLQTQTLTPVAVASSIPVGALATAVLVVNNLRDLETDRRAGKRTLAVRLGRRGTVREYAALVLLPYALLPAFAAGVGLPLALPLLSLPIAASLLRQVTRRPSGPALNATLAGTARLCLVWAALFAIGIVTSSMIGAGG
jgi:1,4-dihydroxy-2-naphthoate octaprenyltransferase